MYHTYVLTFFVAVVAKGCFYLWNICQIETEQFFELLDLGEHSN